MHSSTILKRKGKEFKSLAKYIPDFDYKHIVLCVFMSENQAFFLFKEVDPKNWTVA